jgi:ABC-type lipoprotein release transport system permease subunit
MGKHKNLLFAAADNLAHNPAGYLVAASGLALGLTLLTCGLAIQAGLAAEARGAVQAGADVYCTWDVFGRDGPVPRDKLAELSEIEGVTRAVPRIIGRVPLSGELAIVVGVPLAELAGAELDVAGEVPRSPDQLLVGFELARATGLSPGRTVALESRAIRLFQVSGVVSSTSSLWSAKAIVCDLDEAALVFGEQDAVSDVCLYTRPGYQHLVAEAVARLDARFRVQTQELVERYVARGMTLRGGAFTALFALALALAIPSFCVMTYLGHSPRRREIGLLKAEGWATTDVLEVVTLENLIVSAIVASGSIVVAFAWVELLGAPLIAPFFLPELPLFPGMRIPARFWPLPLVLAFVFSVVVTMTGSIATTWRTAVARPVDVIR